MQIFISYKREDESFARQLHGLLCDWDYTPWLDVLDIPPGENWDDAIFAGLKASEIVVGLLTPESLASSNVLDEWGYGLSNAKRLFLLWLRDVPEADIPPRYIRIQRIDLRADTDSGLAKLRVVLASPTKIMVDETPSDLRGASAVNRTIGQMPESESISVQIKMQEMLQPRPVLTPQEHRNRERMLQKVCDFWVKGVLEKSLYAEARLELGLDYRLGVVDNPWDTVLQHTVYGDYKLPPGSKAIDVFHDLNGEILILGEPGSGKTTTLLELARDLITAAEADDSLPIPVVLNLLSWAAERKPLADWLEIELNTKYQVPTRVAQEWVKTDNLTLLLDGLDEVSPSHRNACVEAINIYRNEHGFVDLVVCSRTLEYAELAAKLKLQGAIVLKPLTIEQVDAYFAAFGGKLDGVRSLLREDETLREMAQSPLMVSIMALAYQAMDVDSLASVRARSQVIPVSLAARSKYVFETYTRRMFERRGNDPRYKLGQPLKWLAWLASYMKNNPQPFFNIQALQPYGLKGPVRRTYLLYCQLLYGLSGGLIGGYFFGIVLGMPAMLEIAMLMYIPAFLIVRKMAREMAYGMLGGLTFAVSFGLANAIAFQTMWGVRQVGSLGIFFGLLIGLLLGIASRTDVHVLETKSAMPHNLYRQSFRAGMIGLACSVASGLFLVLFWLSYEELLPIIVFCLLTGVVAYLVSGGIAVLQHLVLRLILTRAGDAPWNYTHFLDYCAERIFLRKVGGGYIFVHRLLMDYFAALEEVK